MPCNAYRCMRNRASAARLPVALLALSLLAGCGTWVNRGDPAANYGAQLRTCQELAYAKFPPRYDWLLSPFSRFPWSPTCFRTAGRIRCNSFPALHNWPAAEDLNGSARRRETNDCLVANGWTYLSRSQVEAAAAAAIPSQEPAGTPR